MKLATFTHEAVTRIGVVKDDGRSIVDLSRTDAGLPADMLRFLQAGDGAMAKAARAAANAPAAAIIPMADIKLEAPVPRPGKILAIGLNYADHVEETGQPMPENQIWFNKQVTCVNGPYDPMHKPVVSDALDYEAELCMIIGKRARHVPKARAAEVIAGFCCGNDGSVRDWQFSSGGQFNMGKGFDTHGPFGPWLVTADEVGDPHDLDVKCTVNGELRQNSNTKFLIFDCYDMIEHVTKAITLEPGDVIFTGTSSGVGIAFKPPKYLVVGDTVRVEIEKLGHIENRIIAEPGETVIG